MDLTPAYELIKKFEGFSSKPYLCPAGVFTIGYGSTRYPEGRKVDSADLAISKATAEKLLIFDVSRFKNGLMILNPELAENENRFCAILSFVYNVGLTNYRSSTLYKHIKNCDYDLAPPQMRRWIFAGGKKLNGLALRREAEIKLFTTNQQNDSKNN